ncbi:MAG: amidohydrolase family protein, partial [Acidimicrobiales bacterium]
NAIAWTGCGLAAAVAAVTAAPAALVGAADRGRLAVGARADLTLLTPDAEVAATVLAGELVYRGPHRAG